jgi:hypothetical protein
MRSSAAEEFYRALTGAGDNRRIARKIDNRGGYDAARTGVDNSVDGARKTFPDFVGIVQGRVISRQMQSGRKQRLVQLREESLRDFVFRYSQSDGAPARVHEPLRYSARRVQYERIGARRRCLEQTELAVIHPRVLRDFRKVPAHEREVMPFVNVPNGPDAFHGRFVADVTSERVTRVGRINDDATRAHDRRSLPYQPRLRIDRMYGKELCHWGCFNGGFDIY